MPHAGQQVHAIDTCDLNTQNRGELDIFWKSSQNRDLVVGVAQLVELRIVVPAVVGSSPIAHPTTKFSYIAIGADEIRTGLAIEIPCCASHLCNARLLPLLRSTKARSN